MIAVLTGPPVGGRGVPPAGGAAHAAAPVRLLATVGSCLGFWLGLGVIHIMELLVTAISTFFKRQ